MAETAGSLSAAPVLPPFWHPDPQTVRRAHVTRLAAALGVADFALLQALSRSDPARYWRAVNTFLGIRWSRDYREHVDLAQGPEFPAWFVGGELNWIDTVFAPARPGDAVAVIAETEAGTLRRVTYAELQAEVTRFAAGLAALGVRRGDRVGLLMEMGVEAVVGFLAVSHLGAVAAPLFSGFGPEAIVARLASCGASVLLATAGFSRRGRWVDIASTLDGIGAMLPALRRIVLKGGSGGGPGVSTWAEVAGQGRPADPPARMGANDPMMVIYTSGTTGKPKGAVHTHGGFPLKLAHDAAVHFDLGPGDVFFWPADLGWVAGALTIAAALMRGATLVCYDGAPDAPDWSRMARIAARHRVTHLGASPTLIRGLAAHADLACAVPCRDVRLLVTAGEVIAPEHMLWFHQALGRGVCPVINYTGGTEVSGALLANVVVRPIVAAAFNAVSPGIDADVMDGMGRPVRDMPGELSIRAPFVGMTQSFWNDRERYLDTYWRQTPGVWTHGDLALRTEGDVFFLLGRSDDTLKVAGKRLGPAEVEDALLDVAGVREAAAIGIDDPVKGQTLVVFVVPTPDGAAGQAALGRAVTEAVAARLGKPFRPSRVHVVAELPRTRSLKVMRRVIRRVYLGQDAGDLSSLDNPAAIEAVRAAASARRTEPRADPLP